MNDSVRRVIGWAAGRRSVTVAARAAAPPAPAALARRAAIIARLVPVLPVVSAGGLLGRLRSGRGLVVGIVGRTRLTLAAAPATAPPALARGPACRLVLTVSGLTVSGLTVSGLAGADLATARLTGARLAVVVLARGRPGDREMLGYLRWLEYHQRRLERRGRNRLSLGFCGSRGGAGKELLPAGAARRLGTSRTSGWRGGFS